MDRLWRICTKIFCQTTNDSMGSMMDEDQWTRLVRQAENRVQKLWETTKEVSCWLKVRNLCAQENSKSRMFNYLKFIVLLGCRWMPVFPDLPEHGATVSESCCYAGSVVTLGKLWSNQESQEMYVLYKCMWLVIWKHTHWSDINVGGSRVTFRCISVRWTMWWKVGGAFLLVRLWPQN